MRYNFHAFHLCYCSSNSASNTTEELPADLRREFDSAAAYVRQNGGRLSSSAQLLYLYGRYKRVTAGVNTTPRPGLFNAAERQKWDCWTSTAHLSAKQAARDYVDKLAEYDVRFYSLL